MKLTCCCLVLPGFALAKLAFARQLDVLVIGSTHLFSEEENWRTKSPSISKSLMTDSPFCLLKDSRPRPRSMDQQYPSMGNVINSGGSGQWSEWGVGNLDGKLFPEYVPDTIHPTPTGCAKVVTPVILDTLGLEKSSPGTFPTADTTRFNQ